MVAGNLPVIGVLDLQGGTQEHLEHLGHISGCVAKPVKAPDELQALSGLILPGGESTCLSRLFKLFGLHEAIKREHSRGMKVWGTCAGAILIAREIIDEQPHLALMDIAVHRNAFGSQMDSFNLTANIPEVSGEPIPLTFIRAPKIVRVGPGVKILLRHEDFIAAAEDDRCLATAFHPELTSGLAFHRYFAHKCGVSSELHSDQIEGWTARSWMQVARA
ncbi:MAG: pyridoxal 5'-phosphate synthase glutaminase subunit PdxT [Bdellovibrionales bacterium]